MQQQAGLLPHGFSAEEYVATVASDDGCSWLNPIWIDLVRQAGIGMAIV